MTLERHYHGCKVVSDLESKPVKGGDGWVHRVYGPQGVDLGSALTLAEAIAVCKAQAEVLKEQPPVAEAATEVLLEEGE